MFSNQIKELSQKYNNRQFRQRSDLFSILLEQTPFIQDKSAHVAQRLWHIQNDTNSIPLCKHCVIHFVNWKKKEYNQYCSPKCAANSKIVNLKRKNTNIQKYGVDNVFQCDKIKISIRKKNIEKYGVENPSQFIGIQSKKILTNIKKYNRNFFQQISISEDILLKLNSSEWLHNEYVTKNKTSTMIGDALGVGSNTIRRYLTKHNIPIVRKANYSKLAIQWLNDIMDKENIYIQHAGNIGEFNIPNTRLLVDGYCSSNNTVYEFYGDCWHGNPKIFRSKDNCHPLDKSVKAGDLYKQTIYRESRLREIGYNIITIWETDYKNYFL